MTLSCLHRASLTLALVIASGGIGRAQTGSIAGLVYDSTHVGAATDVLPVADAEVVILATKLATKTDTAGAYSFTGLEPGTYVIRIRRAGYYALQRGVTIAAGTKAEVVSFVTRDPRSASEIAMASEASGSSRLAGFEQRRRTGAGRFLSRAQIERRHAASSADLLRSIPGIVVRDTSIGGARLSMLVSTRGANVSHGQLSPCALHIILDDHLMPDGFTIDDVQPTDLVGIEVYPGAASIPSYFASFGASSWCGLVVFWTNDGT